MCPRLVFWATILQNIDFFLPKNFQLYVYCMGRFSKCEFSNCFSNVYLCALVNCFYLIQNQAFVTLLLMLYYFISSLFNYI